MIPRFARVLVLPVLLAAGAAAAQQASPPPGAGQVRKACAADIQKYCGDQQAGPGRRQCMQAHQNDFSPECKDAMAKMRASMPQGGPGGPPPGTATASAQPVPGPAAAPPAHASVVPGTQPTVVPPLPAPVEVRLRLMSGRGAAPWRCSAEPGAIVS